MQTVLLVIHLLLAVALIAVVLLQRSEGGGLGIGSSGGMGGFMTARGTANLLTRTTAILAALFMVTSLVLSIWASTPRERRSIIDDLAPSSSTPSVPTAPDQAPPQSAPAQPAAPSAPIAR